MPVPNGITIQPLRSRLAIRPAARPPDARRLATDAFTADCGRAILYLVDLHTGAIREVGRLAHSCKSELEYHPRVITRAHPHPTWSPDSKTLLGNCNFGGSHLGLVLWENFL